MGLGFDRAKLERIVSEIGARVEGGDDAAEPASDAVRILSAAPPEWVTHAARVLYDSGARGAGGAPGDTHRSGGGAYRFWHDGLGSPWLDVFSRNGHLRADALWQISGPLTSPFRVAAIVYRLNDWVPQVRAAASACAGRTLPLTDADQIIGAAPLLLGRRTRWSRWSIERRIVDEMLARPEVADRLFLRMRGGPTTRLFKEALRSPAYDGRLLELAKGATLPQVRFLAFRALIEGRAVWLGGREWVFTDKVYNKRKLVPRFEQRPIPRPMLVEDLIELAAVDRSPLVRKAAADGLIRFRQQLPNIRQVAQLLRDDKSKPIRERIEWLERKRLEEGF